MYGNIVVAYDGSDEASDALSGMSPVAGSLDPQPRTCVQVPGTGTECEPDAEITRVISTEGDHRVAYFARDLAGNENDPNGPSMRKSVPGSASSRCGSGAL